MGICAGFCTRFWRWEKPLKWTLKGAPDSSKDYQQKMFVVMVVAPSYARDQ